MDLTKIADIKKQAEELDHPELVLLAKEINLLRARAKVTETVK